MKPYDYSFFDVLFKPIIISSSLQVLKSIFKDLKFKLLFI